MDNEMMSDELPTKEALFYCANTIESLKCVQCASFETHNLVHLNYHFKADHTLPESEAKLHQCGSCSFKTYSEFLSTRHQLLGLCTRSGKIKSEAIVQKETRELRSESDDLQCVYCSYETPSKSILETHVKTVHKSSKNRYRKCKQCAYITKNLPSHVLFNHTNPEKIRWFECEQCPYRCKTKSSLTAHTQYKHGDEKRHRCDHCPYRTKYRQALWMHIRAKHTDPEKIKWFECERCSYQSIQKAAVRRHVDLMHIAKKCLKCDRCPFETTSEKGFALHLLSEYSDPDETRWFCCEHCSFESTMKENLLQHKKDMHRRAKIR